MFVDTNAIVVATVLKTPTKKAFAVQNVNIQKGKLKMEKDKIYCDNCGMNAIVAKSVNRNTQTVMVKDMKCRSVVIADTKEKRKIN